MLMKNRQGFVSNSSSSSFVVALRKGHTWQDVIESVGMFSPFAKMLADYVGPMESIQNIELAYAGKDVGSYIAEETIAIWAKDGQYDYVRKGCEDIVEDPQEWYFFYGNADYDTTNPVEAWAGNGGEIDGENVKVKRVPQ